MRRFLLASLALLCAGAIAMAQQAPAAPPAAGQQPSVTFRTETNFVEVHAIVTDQKGAFVKDLTRDDFEIYEDGRLQSPSVFSLVDMPVERPFVPAAAAGPIEPDVRATTRTFDGRVYIILLDDLHTNVTRSNNVKEVAKKFVDEYLGTNDLAAVVYTSGRQESGQELTNSHRLLKAAIDRFLGRKLPSAGAEKLAVHTRQIANQNAMSEESQEIRTSEGLQQAQSIKDPFDMERALNARRALQSIENISGWLADVQGRRKALLFFSEGFDYDIYQPFNINRESSSVLQETQEAMAAAQRANVNVYGIDPRGMSQFGEMIEISSRSDYPQLEYGTFRGQLRELLLAQESLISLSEETGGIPIVNSGDLAGGLGRIVLDNSRYFLLGYYSDSARWSRNKFLKIEVRVKRPGLQVRARKGFLPPDTRAVERAREADVKAGTTPALRAALGKPVRAAGGKGASVLVALEIDGPSLKFEPRDGRFAESIEVSIVAADERARVQGGDRQTFNLNLVPETHARVSRTGVRMLSHLDLPPGRYQIRVGAHESTGRAIGTVPYDLEVPDYTKVPFDMSGVLLTSSSASAFATANQETDWNGLLPSPPVVTRTFSPSDTLTWFAEVYDNSSPSAHTLNYTTTILDARTGRQLAQARDNRSVGADSKGLAQGFTTSLPLRDATPGTYILRVEASSTVGGHSARRDVLFEVR
jgi:VWFA-related protein